jgi:ABC-type branched-subunit amino acid transport system substrate-binding protein
MRRLLIIAAALLVLAGCTSGTSNTSAGAPDTTARTGATTDAREATIAPGVTPTAIKVGVVYVDNKALAAVGLNYDLGDYEGSYQALVDQINAHGGIHGRKIELSFAPVNPVGTASATAACLKVTSDEKVFVAVGFFLNDAVLCPVATHHTAVIGGGQTTQLLAQAQAPWFTTIAGPEVPVNVIKAFDAKHLLTGKVAVFAQAADSDLLNNEVMPALAKLGVKPVKAILDIPAGDVPALMQGARTIAQRFQSEGVDKVILVGPSSADWYEAMAGQSYKPQLLISDYTGVNAFISNASTHDTSLLKGSVAGGTYGPDPRIYAEAGMQACFETLRQAGISVPAPDASKPNEKGYTGPEDACVNVALLKALLEKAGRDLNYATFRQAGYTLGSVALPGDPNPRRYGPPPATDGDPQAYLSTWDPTTKSYVPEGS